MDRGATGTRPRDGFGVERFDRPGGRYEQAIESGTLRYRDARELARAMRARPEDAIFGVRVVRRSGEEHVGGAAGRGRADEERVGAGRAAAAVDVGKPG